jgi:ABC-2 type transport system permease protein
MLWYKVWRESSVRFLVSATALAGVCVVRVLFEHRFFPDVAHERPCVHNYIQYLYWTIFGAGGRGVLQLSCLLLGLGGLQRDRKQNTLGFTLALPVSRPRLVAIRALVGYLQIFALSLLPPFIVWAASPLVHQSMPLSYGLNFLPFWTIGGFATFSITFLCSVLFTGEYTAFAVGSVSYFFYIVVCQSVAPFRLYPVHVAEFMGGRLGNVIDPHTLLWTGNSSLTLLAGFALAAITLIAASALITARQDL